MGVGTSDRDKDLCVRTVKHHLLLNFGYTIKMKPCDVQSTKRRCDRVGFMIGDNKHAAQYIGN